MNHSSRNVHLQKGLDFLRHGDFFAAHEEWEIPWREMAGRQRIFWQAMIQLSVGAYHFEKQNRTGCLNLWNKALKRCNQLLENHAGPRLAPVAELREALLLCLEKTAAGEDPRPEIRRFAANTVQPGWFEFA
jgi:predicted metal-dependent hydrolase